MCCYCCALDFGTVVSNFSKILTFPLVTTIQDPGLGPRSGRCLDQGKNRGEEERRRGEEKKREKERKRERERKREKRSILFINVVRC